MNPLGLLQGDYRVFPNREIGLRLLEEAALNAWPSLETVYYDGWLLRFADGFTRRANSVNPVYSSMLPAAVKVRHCEALYASRGLPSVFKMTPFSEPQGLDDLLETYGYRRAGVTSVQTLALDSLKWTTISENLTIREKPDEEWLANYCLFNGVSDARRALMERMLAAVIPTTAYAMLRNGGEPVALGLAVRERDLVGLFDITTAPDMRGRGFGTQLIGALLEWGAQEGARHAYLQVMLSNSPALALYDKFGFAEVYRYWYRVKELTATQPG